MKVLIPLHKARSLSLYHAQVCIVCTQVVQEILILGQPMGVGEWGAIYPVVMIAEICQLGLSPVDGIIFS